MLVKAVQRRLGHQSAMETLDTYGHLWPDGEDETRNAVDMSSPASPSPAESRSSPLQPGLYEAPAMKAVTM